MGPNPSLGAVGLTGRRGEVLEEEGLAVEGDGAAHNVLLQAADLWRLDWTLYP